MFLNAGIFWFSQYAYLPFLNPYLKGMGAAASVVGLVAGSYGFVQLFLKLPLGIVVDRHQLQKLSVSLSFFLCMISSLGFFWLRTPMAYLLFRAMAGLASCGWVSFTVLYANYFDAEHAPKSVGRLNSSNYTGRLLAFLMGGILAQNVGVESVFIVCAIVAGIGFILSLTVQQNKKPVATFGLRDILEVIKDRNLLAVATLATLCQTMAFSTIYSFSSDIAKSIGATSMELGLMNIFLTFPIILVTFLSGGYLMTRFGAQKLVITGFLMMAFYCMVIPFVGQVYVLYLLQLIGGAGQGLTLTLLMGLSIRDVDLDKRTTAMGFFQAAYGVGMTLGPIMMGLLVDVFSGQYRLPFIIMSLFSVVGAVWSFHLLRRHDLVKA
jgi:MFS family permease